MPKTVLRFYEELNDLLPKHRRGADFEAEFEGKRSVKDMIEAQGVPHTEVDLILVNGVPEDFSYIIQDGDRISVYPVFESLNIKNVTRLRKFPLRKSRFIADINIRDIVKAMRLLGFDVYFDPSFSHKEITVISKSENRIILTRSKKLLKLKDVTHGILIYPGQITDQIKRIIDYLDIRDQIKPFSRCLICNALLEGISKEKIENRIPPKTKESCDQYAYCRPCDKVYWRGTHFIRMKNLVDGILGNSLS